MTDINIGKISEALNNKSDRDFLNIASNADAVVAYQEPTAENNYTWYRIYKSGWVEQGGNYRTSTNNQTYFQVDLPIALNQTVFYAACTGTMESSVITCTEHTADTVTFFYSNNLNPNPCSSFDWTVSGKGDPNAVRNAIIDVMIAEGSSVSYNISNLTDYIIAYQEPTLDNNYTWYRVWNSGWVEQGGLYIPTTAAADANYPITLPVSMSNTSYNVCLTAQANTDLAWCSEEFNLRTTTGFGIQVNAYQNSGVFTAISWEVKGQGDSTVIGEMIASSAISNAVNTYVTEMQLPTAQNNYTWYKKYSNNYVEMGGRFTGLTSGSNAWQTILVDLPVEMANVNYTVTTSGSGIGAEGGAGDFVNNFTVNSFDFKYFNANANAIVSWRAEGMAAVSNS